MQESLSTVSPKTIIGLDEVGTGSYAGPCLIGAVRATSDWSIPGLADSKALSAKKREAIARLLLIEKEEGRIQFVLIPASPAFIDEKGLGTAHKLSFITAIQTLYTGGENAEEVILDGNLNPKHLEKLGLFLPASIRSEPKADSRYPTVMAAAILAKVYRDGIMKELAKDFPGYEWEKNVGYLAPAHIEGIKKLGLTEHHRKSYKVQIEPR